jgi:acyl-coenzyme A synthetase/AMP-(fatty) acid ligase
VFPAALIHAIWDRLGVEFMYMYGSSEGVGVATTNRADMLLGAVGRPAPGSCMIVGPDRKPLMMGEVGEIAFSRRVYPVQYYGDGNQGSVTEEWYFSGDLGQIDAEGRLFVRGRLKHQIDRGGLKVDPVEVETELLRYPAVYDATVIGRPNPILGEVVCACVAPVEGEVPTLTETRAFLSGHLAPFKLPEELVILSEIPRTKIGKVDLERLQERIEATSKVTAET